MDYSTSSSTAYAPETEHLRDRTADLRTHNRNLAREAGTTLAELVARTRDITRASGCGQQRRRGKRQHGPVRRRRYRIHRPRTRTSKLRHILTEILAYG